MIFLHDIDPWIVFYGSGSFPEAKNIVYCDVSEHRWSPQLPLGAEIEPESHMIHQSEVAGHIRIYIGFWSFEPPKSDAGFLEIQNVSKKSVTQLFS